MFDASSLLQCKHVQSCNDISNIIHYLPRFLQSFILTNESRYMRIINLGRHIDSMYLVVSMRTNQRVPLTSLSGSIIIWLLSLRMSTYHHDCSGDLQLSQSISSATVLYHMDSYVRLVLMLRLFVLYSPDCRPCKHQFRLQIIKTVIAIASMELIPVLCINYATIRLKCWVSDHFYTITLIVSSINGA